MDINNSGLQRRSSVSFSQNHLDQHPRRLAVAAAVFALTLVGGFAATAAQATNAVGAIAGYAGASSTGAATYAIPINVPPGTNGMQPSLALVYDSQSDEGLVGYRWTLSGLSAISRCPQNPEEDGTPYNIPIQYAATDDYCLDGQRLKLISGTNGGNGSTYGTEFEAFSLITSYTGSGIAGGPGYFTVQTKDGRTYEYGNTADSRIVASASTTVVRTWALDKVTDANGNTMTYLYGNSSTAGFEYWPVSISYTANGSTAADHQVVFDYTTRAAGTVETAYTQGSLVTVSALINKIEVKYAGTDTFVYNLNYNQDPVNSRYRLSSVQECGKDGTCLPQTSISWSSASAGWGPKISTGISVSDADHATAAHLMDVDGDGIDDLVYPDTASNDWKVAFGLPSGGFSTPVDTGLPLSNSYYQYALATDFNGDGRTDLIVPVANNNHFQVFASTGNRVSGQGGIFQTPSISLPDMSAPNSVSGLPMYEGNVWMADYSGGSLGDMFNDTGSILQWRQNGGPSTGETFASPQTVYSATNLQKFNNPNFVDIGSDFDGSGRAGALLFSNSGTLATLTALTPTANNSLAQMATISNAYWGGAVFTIPYDSNGDGLTDVLSADQNEFWRISLSTGTGFNTVSSTIQAWTNPSSPEDAFVADYANSGHQSAIVFTGPVWYALDATYNPSNSSFSLTSTAIPAASSPPIGDPSLTYVTGTLRVGPIEANGMDDVVFALTNGTSYTWYYALHNSGATAPDV